MLGSGDAFVGRLLVCCLELESKGDLLKLVGSNEWAADCFIDLSHDLFAVFNELDFCIPNISFLANFLFNEII